MNTDRFRKNHFAPLAWETITPDKHIQKTGKTGTDQDRLSKIPVELLLMIFQRSSIGDLLMVRQVSRFFRSIIDNSDHVWKQRGLPVDVKKLKQRFLFLKQLTRTARVVQQSFSLRSLHHLSDFPFTLSSFTHYAPNVPVYALLEGDKLGPSIKILRYLAGDLLLDKVYENFITTKLAWGGLRIVRQTPEIIRLSLSTVYRFRTLCMLNLSKCNLQDCPKEVGALANLKMLDLRWNMFRELPAQLGNITKLRWLCVSNNHLTTLPSTLGKLIALTSLNLSENALTAVPNAIAQLSRLKILLISHNKLEKVPPEIGNLKDLKQLSVAHNALSSLPQEIGGLTSLEVLNANNNRLSSLPSGIGSLLQLKRFFVQNNHIKDLPNTFANLTSLVVLDLQGNSLSKLPPGIAGFTALTKLYIQRNNFVAEHR